MSQGVTMYICQENLIHFLFVAAVARLFLFAQDHLFFVKNLNESVSILFCLFVRNSLLSDTVAYSDFVKCPLSSFQRFVETRDCLSKYYRSKYPAGEALI